MGFKLGNMPTMPATTEIKTEVRAALSQIKEDDHLIERHQPPEVIEPIPVVESDESITDDDRKMERLIADDFPFDESQVFSIDGMVQSQYACLTGAAGTGKTTCTKKLVDKLMTETAIGRVDMREYWAKTDEARQDAYDDSDDYQLDEKNPVIPTILMCSFTGRATQQIKKNFPKSWHNNIMTIHRALGFMPEWYEDWDPDLIDKFTGEAGAYRNKMRFVPTYTADCLMPWDIILVDESGMLGLDLWHQLLAAVKPGARIYLIGDINQLPPVHGKSIFGFAMTKWPAYELTHVHRQAGVDNPIVDNAWRVIHGLMPVSEGAFQMIPLKDNDGQWANADIASRKVRKIVPQLRKMEIYDPIRDAVITPINGFESTSRGYQLGQMPLNQEFAIIFNGHTENPRFIIDGGRDRKKFAVGDKVMATVNDYEAGITNGMTGLITSIEPHPGYAGDMMRFGPVDEVNARYAEGYVEDDIGVIDFESLNNSFAAIEQGRAQAKDKRERGPSSHVVVVRFGSEDHGFEVPFDTLAKVGSLMTAYVVTCHKMQGGEAPTIVVIIHDSHKAMMYREWLYTAITRASQRCILLYTETALRACLNKQTIKGRSLKEKVESFNQLMLGSADINSVWSKEVRLPECAFSGPMILDREDHEFRIPERLITEADRNSGVMQLLNMKKKEAAPTPPVTKVEIKIGKVEVNVIHQHQAATPVAPIDGGTLHAEPVRAKGIKLGGLGQPLAGLVPPVVRTPGNGSGNLLPAPVAKPAARYVSQRGAIKMALELSHATENAQRLLTRHTIAKEATEVVKLIDGPVEPAEPKPLRGLAFLMSLQNKGKV